MPEPIPFNRLHVAGRELAYVAEAVARGNTSGGRRFSEACGRLLHDKFGFGELLLTNSCTAALEISAILLGCREGDEVLMPSFTHVATATAFARLGARPVFVDIRSDTLNLDEDAIEAALTERTRAIVPVHYGGVACNMEAILAIARKRGLAVVEDAAQCLGARYREQPLGSIGDLGCISFHETKNVHCGQGGALCVNDAAYLARARAVHDFGTNRWLFLRGEVPRYSWVDLGSSFALSEILSAFLCAQLEASESIAEARARIHGWYAGGLARLEERGHLRLPRVPADCQTNHHIASVILADGETRDGLMQFLGERSIQAVTHYVPLHSSPYGRHLGPHAPLPVTEEMSARLLRLPLFNDLAEGGVARVVEAIEAFFRR